MTRLTVLLLAVAAGAAVGNLYWAQPLLELIDRDLHASSGSAGWLVTATQLGYACGILLIVPLGDTLNRRRLVPMMLLCAAATLVLCSLAPTFPTLLAAVSLLGLTTVSGQLIVPLAGDLVDDQTRGQGVGLVTSGVLTGILVSRTLGGIVAGAVGWRAIYAAAAIVAVALAAILFRRIPDLPPKTRLPYPALLGSVLTVIAQERRVRWCLAMGATQFATFTMFWTALRGRVQSGRRRRVDRRGEAPGCFGVAGGLAGQGRRWHPEVRFSSDQSAAVSVSGGRTRLSVGGDEGGAPLAQAVPWPGIIQSRSCSRLREADEVAWSSVNGAGPAADRRCGRPAGQRRNRSLDRPGSAARTGRAPALHRQVSRCPYRCSGVGYLPVTPSMRSRMMSIWPA